MSRRNRRTRSRSASSEPLASEGDSPDLAGHRQERLEHIILNELQSLVRDEAADPAVDGVTLLALHLSVDGGHARVAYAVVAPLDREQEVAQRTRAGLTRATRFLRARLAQQLNLKKLPQLSFAFVGLTEAPGATPWVE